DAPLPPESDPALAVTDAAVPHEGDSLIGTSVGRYRVLARVGAGGMGVVYRALDPALDRTVALKVLPPLDEARRGPLEERLRREAQALARLDHENVVAVFDVGLAEASLFVAMQFVDGATLDEHLAQHPARPRRVLALFVAAGRGLAAAHAAGIIHRDVKPSNILVDRAARVYIGDFGLARGSGEVEPRTNSDHDLLVADVTRAGAVVGTPLFMAPEQLRGETASARSDQFSFCVSLWHQLFAHHPFVEGRWEREAALAAMERDRVLEPPRIRGVPARVVRALRRGLRHDPDARWPELADLLSELEPPSRLYWTLGGLTAVGLAAGALSTVVVGGALSSDDPCEHASDRLAAVVTPARTLDLSRGFAASGVAYAPATASRVQSAIARYGDAWSAMRIDACRANRVRHEQSDELFDRRMECLDQRLLALDSRISVLADRPTAEVVDRAIALISALPAIADCEATQVAAGPQPAAAGLRAQLEPVSAELERARARLAAGTIESTASADQLVARARALGSPQLLGRALAHAGNAYQWASDRDTAIARLREAAVEAARARDDRLAAEALLEVGYLTGDRGKPADGLVVLADAELTVVRAGDPPALRAKLEASRANALAQQSRFDEASAAFDKAIATIRADPSHDPLALANALVDQAEMLHRGGKRPRARELLHEAQRIFEDRLTGDHPRLATLHAMLGNIELQLGNPEGATAEYDRAMAIARRRFPAGDLTIAKLEFSFGSVAMHEGRLDDAAAAFERAYRQHVALQPDQPDTFKALYMIGAVRLSQGRYDEALAAFEPVFAYRRDHLGEGSVDTANVLEAIANVHQARDEYATALAIRK
ncbi:MAG: protein kinase domain-containing protein, partial [Kofleriaceae bacterium]